MSNFKYKSNFITYIIAAFLLFTFHGCGVKYSLGGGTIPENMKTYSVEIFENISPFVSATLSQTFTEGLKERIRTQSKLSQVNQDGDAMFSGVITNYAITPAAVEAGTDWAALNRLSITVKVKYVNRKDDTGESDFEDSFTQFKEFRGQISANESQLNSEIVKMLTEDVFNRAFNNW